MKLIIEKNGEERGLFLFAAILVAAGAGLAFGFLSPRRGAADAGAIVGIVLVALGILSVFRGIAIARIRPKTLTLSETGLFDPQLMASEIPWTDVTGIDLTNRGKLLLNFRINKAAMRAANRNVLAKLLHGTTGAPGIAYQPRNFREPFEEVARRIGAWRLQLPAHVKHGTVL